MIPILRDPKDYAQLRGMIRELKRRACYDESFNPDAPEGLELFRWEQTPIAEEITLSVMPAMPIVATEGRSSDLDTRVETVTLRPILTGTLQLDSSCGLLSFSVWVSWDRWERVAVIACGPETLFPRGIR